MVPCPLGGHLLEFADDLDCDHLGIRQLALQSVWTGAKRAVEPNPVAKKSVNEQIDGDENFFGRKSVEAPVRV
jgi:hypothetical protein